MSMKRREFLKTTVGGTAALVGGIQGRAWGQARTKDKIRIGAARPLSGPYAFFEANAFGPIYKMWVDEVNSKGGITFWAHPEAKESKSINKIIVNTLNYPECVKATTNYTGFGVFWEGYQKIGLPNGKPTSIPG